MAATCLALAIAGCGDEDNPPPTDAGQDAELPPTQDASGEDASRADATADASPSDAGTECVAGRERCGTACVDLQSDSENCGACGTACAAGEACSAGACTAVCPGTQLNCNGSCVDPKTDLAFCGATTDCKGSNVGVACPTGNVCSAGVCGVSCVGAQIICGGKCIDAETDRDYCGAQLDCAGANDGASCASGEVCVAGACAVSCPSGQVQCNGKCIDPATDRGYCGASLDCTGANDGVACPAGQVCSNSVCALSCAAGQLNCAGNCIDPQSDRGYCGATLNCTGANDGDVCMAGQVCSNAVCALTCAAGQLKCNGKCIDPMTDRTYCGAMLDCAGANDGDVCMAGQVCNTGACALSCAAGQLNCNGKCIDPMTDRTYCGAMLDCAGTSDGDVCAAGSVCSLGVCSLSCASGQINCAGKCIDPQTDRTYCGASNDCTGTNDGELCAPGQVCSNSACVLSCAPGQLNCGGKCVDPMTDRTYCGAQLDCAGVNDGDVCLMGTVCNSGACALSCASGQINCAGKCVDPFTDRNFCGATTDCTGPNDGNVCLAGQVCSNGACALSCASGQLNCNGKCIDPTTDNVYCGAQGDCTGSVNDGSACAPGQICAGSSCVANCPGTQISCGGNCVDPFTDPTYCGATGNCMNASAGVACGAGQVCSGGSCAVSCPGTQIVCNGTCVDPATDNTYCGATTGCSGATAGTPCGSGTVCSNRTCSPTCASPQINCNGTCVDPNTDRGFCGATDCSAPATDGDACNPGQVCVNKVCTASCPTGQISCNGKCIDPQTDPGYCGAMAGCSGATAGASCTGGTACVSGACRATCATGQVACNGVCIDPRSNPTYCGATTGCGAMVGSTTTGSAGTTCTPLQACVNGSCLELATKLFFTSSVAYDGNLGGLAGADMKCQTLATAAGRAGTFKAWLSSSTVDAASRLTHATVPYVRADGTILANNWTDLTDGSLAASPNLNEYGAAGPTGTAACGQQGAWTGSYANGTVYNTSAVCTDWTVNNSTSGITGYRNFFTSQAWSLACYANCSGLIPLYCIQQ